MNMDKSELIPIRRVDNTKELATKLGCKVVSLASTYLSLPLGALFKSQIIVNIVEERFDKRLAIWKR